MGKEGNSYEYCMHKEELGGGFRDGGAESCGGENRAGGARRRSVLYSYR